MRRLQTPPPRSETYEILLDEMISQIEGNQRHIKTALEYMEEDGIPLAIHHLSILHQDGRFRRFVVRFLKQAENPFINYDKSPRVVNPKEIKLDWSEEIFKNTRNGIIAPFTQYNSEIADNVKTIEDLEKFFFQLEKQDFELTAGMFVKLAHVASSFHTGKKYPFFQQLRKKMIELGLVIPNILYSRLLDSALDERFSAAEEILETMRKSQAPISQTQVNKTLAALKERTEVELMRFMKILRRSDVDHQRLYTSAIHALFGIIRRERVSPINVRRLVEGLMETETEINYNTYKAAIYLCSKTGHLPLIYKMVLHLQKNDIKADLEVYESFVHAIAALGKVDKLKPVLFYVRNTFGLQPRILVAVRRGLSKAPYSPEGKALIHEIQGHLSREHKKSH